MNNREIRRQHKEFSDKRIRLIKDIDAMYSHIFDIYERINRMQQGIIDHLGINARLDPVRDASRIRRNTRYIDAADRELKEYSIGLRDEEDLIDRLIHDLDSITSDYNSRVSDLLNQYRSTMHDMWVSIDAAKK